MHFCVNEIMNISKVKLKLMINLPIGCIFVNLIFIYYKTLWFSFKPWGLPVIKNNLLIWNKVAHDIQRCFECKFECTPELVTELFWEVKIRSIQEDK